ncbi:hypothetical protein HG66A1_39070 [Gimesia chilikensis]|uniref:Uncharacterized protein n=1 Tax=Gimesia chilikensis TaxID=2605989 RepID=A0A517PRV7_9PLAN|nr:hypothetical protein HG66A1_39070 [Gimesia chilikensis]
MHSQHSFKRKCVKYLSSLMLSSVLFLLVYILSLGPMVALGRRPIIPVFAGPYVSHPDNLWIERIYAPLYDFHEPYVCSPHLGYGSAARKEWVLLLRNYVDYCQGLKVSIKKSCPSQFNSMIPGFCSPAISQPDGRAVW